MKKLSAKLLLLLFITGMASCKKEMKPDLPANKKETEQAFMGGDYWTPLTGPIINAVGWQIGNLSFSANDKLYVALFGYNQLWQYDLTVSQWVLKQSPFFNSQSSYWNAKYVFTHGNAIYFFNTTDKSMTQFDLSTAQWSNKAGFPGTASAGITAAFTATKGYLMGGTNGEDNNGVPYTVAENWEYDFVSDRWTLKGNTPGSARCNAAAYAVGDKVYFGTGASVQLFFNPFYFSVRRVEIIDADWWEYNTTTNSWIQKTSFGGGVRQETRGFVIGGNVYLGMGSTTAVITGDRSDLWSYNPVSDTWSQRAAYPPGHPFLPWFTTTGAAGQGFAVENGNDGYITNFWSYTAPYSIRPPIGFGTGKTIRTTQP